MVFNIFMLPEVVLMQHYKVTRVKQEHFHAPIGCTYEQQHEVHTCKSGILTSRGSNNSLMDCVTGDTHFFITRIWASLVFQVFFSLDMGHDSNITEFTKTNMAHTWYGNIGTIRLHYQICIQCQKCLHQDSGFKFATFCIVLYWWTACSLFFHIFLSFPH